MGRRALLRWLHRNMCSTTRVPMSEQQSRKRAFSGDQKKERPYAYQPSLPRDVRGRSSVLPWQETGHSRCKAVVQRVYRRDAKNHQDSLYCILPSLAVFTKHPGETSSRYSFSGCGARRHNDCSTDRALGKSCNLSLDPNNVQLRNQKENAVCHRSQTKSPTKRT